MQRMTANYITTMARISSSSSSREFIATTENGASVT